MEFLHLERIAPGLFKNADFYLRGGDVSYFKQLVYEAKRSKKLTELAREALEEAKKTREVSFGVLDLIVAAALMEAAYKYWIMPGPNVSEIARAVAERLAERGEVDITNYMVQYRRFMREIADAVYIVNLRLYYVRELVEGLGLSRDLVVESRMYSDKFKDLLYYFDNAVEEGLMDIPEDEDTLAEYTLVDKILAFLWGFRNESFFSLTMLNAIRSGETIRALALTPREAYRRYLGSASRLAVDPPFAIVMRRLLRSLSEFDEIENAKLLTVNNVENVEGLVASTSGKLELITKVKDVPTLLRDALTWRRQEDDMAVRLSKSRGGGPSLNEWIFYKYYSKFLSSLDDA